MATIHYNQNLNDVLIVKIEGVEATNIKEYQDFVAIYNGNKVIGFNFFKLKNKFEIKENGIIYHPSNELLNYLNNVLLENKLEKIEINLPDFRVGKVIECSDIEGTHLHLCKVDIKETILQIVCGASNVALNSKVIVANIGTPLRDGTIIQLGKLKGYDSYGMLCSKAELGIENHGVKGLHLLSDDEYSIGDNFIVQ